MTDASAVADEVRSVRPTAVVHLAARSSVAASWERSADVWVVNVLGVVNVLDAVRDERPEARVLLASSAEVYGQQGEAAIPETTAVAPLSPYGASKAAAEIACGRAERGDGLDVVVARSFPHAGPGQDERFAIGSWTLQIARLEVEGGGPLRVGDVSVRRDIVDVRDVCRAYSLLLDRGVPAGIYNVASGTAVAMERVVEILVDLARCPISVEADPSRVRRADVPVLCGDASRLRAATGWWPRIPLEKTIGDALEEARAVAAEERMANA